MTGADGGGGGGPVPGKRRAGATTKPRKQFGTFGGVFTPTLLTILGVIMFLREGWVLGNAGLLGGFGIILLSFGITAFTGLAMSSITTNIRIGAGGAYAIIAQSLGLEVGGSLGIPRYLSQALAVTMYLFGFREGWLWVFPEHSAILVDLLAFLLLYVIAYRSADLAIRVQYVIMVIIAVALASVAVAAYQGSMQYDLTHVGLWGSFRGAPEHGFAGTDFWTVFAVFFPASTGIMAGANMSGDLKDPKRSIPLGTMAAIALSLVIYLLLGYWLIRSASVEELTSNYTVMMDKAFWGPAVLAGLLGATFSSALASLVGSARILQAMGDHEILPGSDWFARLSPEGEPRQAMMVTGGIILLSLLFRDLNAVAPVITMFYLITYAMINAVVLIEQSLGLVSFRPLLRIPRWVSLAGFLGSIFVMFVIHPAVALVSVAVVLAFYVILVRSRLEPKFGDMRSGLFVSVAEWAAKKVADLPSMQERAWKPNLLVPVDDVREVRGAFLLLRDLTHPKGSVKLVGLEEEVREDPGALRSEILELSAAFRDRGVFSSWTVIEGVGFGDGLIAGMQAMRGAFFRPNVLFLTMPRSRGREEAYVRLVREAEREAVGTILHVPEPRTGLGQRRNINVWIRDRSPDWRISMDIGNLDLPLLTAYKLKRNWEARMRLITVVADESEVEPAREFLGTVVELGRMPDARVLVYSGSFDDRVALAPRGDVNVFGLLASPDFAFARRMVEATASTCLFVRDSGEESALA